MKKKKAITKKDYELFIKSKLKTSTKWALKGLITIYRNQTPDERTGQMTKFHNALGFTAYDAPILSSIAESYINTNAISADQLRTVKNIIPKYWEQILHASDLTKLHGYMADEFSEQTELSL